MSRVNSDIRLRIVGADNSGPAVTSAMRNIDKLDQKAARSSMFGGGAFGIGRGGRMLASGLKYGGPGLAMAGMVRSLQAAEDAISRFQLPDKSVQSIKLVNGYFQDIWAVAKALPGMLAAAAAEWVGLGQGGAPIQGHVPNVRSREDIAAALGAGPGNFPAARKAAERVKAALAIEAQVAADKESTDEMRARAGHQTGREMIELMVLKAAFWGGRRLRRLPGLFGDIGLNMAGGLQTNLRGLGIFGAGVGRSMEGIGAEMGGRFGRRGEREELRDLAMEPHALRVKQAREQLQRALDMAERKELDRSEIPGIARGLLRGLEGDSQRRGVAPVGGRFTTMGATQDQTARAQAKTNQLIEKQNQLAKDALGFLKKIAGQPVPARGPGF
jgi:hypothetical protein